MIPICYENIRFSMGNGFSMGNDSQWEADAEKQSMIQKGTLLSGRYTLIKQLGHGGFSAVWLAFDNSSKVQVALKIYAPDDGLDDQGINEFREEFSLVFDLNHNNILRPFQYEVHSKIPFLVLPFCKNGSSETKKGKMSEDDIWHFIYDVASGLSYLHNHRKKIIHQDIKPANILINDDGTYLITDFGISVKLHATMRRTMGDISNMSKGIGTLAYMGPERFGENPTSVLASDIWSLGASIYELITGSTPFGEDGGIIQRKNVAIPRISQNISKDLKALIYACLSKEPWNRPTANDLVKVCSDRKYARKIIYPRLNHKIVAAILFILIVVGGFYGWDIWHKKQQAEDLCANGDTIIMAEKHKLDTTIIESHRIIKQFNSAISKYNDAIEMGIGDESRVDQIKKRINSLSDIVTTCETYDCVVDTLRDMIETERLVSAKEYENKRQQLSDKIKTKINTL